MIFGSAGILGIHCASKTIARQGPHALTNLGSGVAGRVQLRPRGAECGEQFSCDALDGLNVPPFAEHLEPGQLAGVLADYLFGDSLVLFVLEKDINAGLDSAVFLLWLYLRHAS